MRTDVMSMLLTCTWRFLNFPDAPTLHPHLSLDPLHSAHRCWRIRLTPDPAWQHPAPLTRSTTHSYPSCNMSFTSPARELSRLMCLRCDPASGACFSRQSSELIDDGAEVPIICYKRVNIQSRSLFDNASRIRLQRMGCKE